VEYGDHGEELSGTYTADMLDECDHPVLLSARMTEEQAALARKSGRAGRLDTVSGAGRQTSRPAMFDRNEVCQRDHPGIGSTTDRPSLQVAKDLWGLLASTGPRALEARPSKCISFHFRKNEDQLLTPQKTVGTRGDCCTSS
jgi:hypothetical protein